MAKLGLMGGGLSSRSMRAERRRGSSTRPEEPGKKKKSLPLSVLVRDAAELVEARKGRLALGFGLLLISRLAGLVLPGTTKILLDDVIGQHRQDLLVPIVLATAIATLIQAVTGFALSQVLGKAAQRSITEMRRAVQEHVGRLRVSFFDQTKTGILLSRVMTDAEGIRNLVGTGLVELAGGILTALLALGILFYFSVKLTLIALGVGHPGRLLRVRLAADAISFFTVRGVAGEPLKVFLLLDCCAPQVTTAAVALERVAVAIMSIVIAGLISFFAVHGSRCRSGGTCSLARSPSSRCCCCRFSASSRAGDRATTWAGQSRRSID